MTTLISKITLLYNTSTQTSKTVLSLPSWWIARKVGCVPMVYYVKFEYAKICP